MGLQGRLDISGMPTSNAGCTAAAFIAAWWIMIAAVIIAIVIMYVGHGKKRQKRPAGDIFSINRECEEVSHGRSAYRGSRDFQIACGLSAEVAGRSLMLASVARSTPQSKRVGRGPANDRADAALRARRSRGSRSVDVTQCTDNRGTVC
jgi:hypothetical protein